MIVSIIIISIVIKADFNIIFNCLSTILLSSSLKSPLYNPFPKLQILDSSKLKEFADDNFKSDENHAEFPKRVGNTVEKWEIAPYEQISPFCTVFSEELYSRHENKGIKS